MTKEAKSSVVIIAAVTASGLKENENENERALVYLLDSLACKRMM